MTTNKTENNQSLEDVLYALSAETREVDAELVEEYVRAHPDHAEAITQLAIALALDSLDRSESHESKASTSEMTTVTPAVSRAMSKFQNLLYELRKPTGSSAPRPTPPVAKAKEVNPFATLDRDRFRAVARELNANTVFVQKLRDRQITRSTMSIGFLDKVSGALNVPVDLLIAHLDAIPVVQMTPQYSKAEEKPHVVARQTFEEAVRSSGLSDEQQQHLLSL